ncbi:MAG TPA: sialidase family protein [Flavipsychrobacter sp.]|nr:sialidase family protein [Flavipsychrobacter sp.]
MKKLLILLCVMYSAYAVAQDEVTDNYKISSEASLSLNSPYHASEGILMTIGKDSLLDIFRLDTSNAHMSNYGSIVKRFSYDGGKTWTPYTLVYHGPADDRNIGGGYKNGMVIVFFRELNQGHGYVRYLMFSHDKGKTFTSPARVAQKIQTVVGVPFGQLVTADSGKIYQLYYSQSKINLIYSYDGTNWSVPTEVYNDTSRVIGEPAMVYCGKGKLLILARRDKGYFPYEQFVSSDNGNTWVDEGSTNIGVDATPFTFNDVSPYMTYDSVHDVIIALATIRPRDRKTGGTTGGVLLYVNTPASVFTNRLGWSFRGKLNRPEPNMDDFYGYPVLARINKDEWIGILTDAVPVGGVSGYTIYGHQHASLYQFTITYNEH